MNDFENPPTTLSLDDQFTIAKFSITIDNTTDIRQLKEIAKLLLKQSVLAKSLAKSVMRKQIGIPE
jgi:hypothetical protein